MIASIGCFITAKDKYFQLQLMRESLSKKNISELKDGQKTVVFGQIFPNSGQPIIGPITQEKCIFYFYDVYRRVWSRSSSNTSTSEKQTDLSGFYLTQSSVKTALGDIRLLAFPTLQGFDKKTYTYSDSTANIFNFAASYFQNTVFEDFGKMELSKLGKAFQMVKDILADDDGYVRKDTKYCSEPFDLKTRLIDEQFVKEGENVCLLGIWSSVKQGIIADLSKSAVILTKGMPEQTIKVAKGEVFKKIGQGLLISLVINLIIGVIWWIVNEGPKYGTVTFS